MTSRSCLEMFSQSFAAGWPGPGHQLAIAALAGDRLAPLALADWLEEWFQPCQELTATLIGLRNLIP